MIDYETGEIIATDAGINANTWRPMGVRNLNPMLVERGKIKIGMKGAARQSKSGGSYQMPQKLDHFLVTTMERGQDNNFVRDSEIMGILGENPREIPITLIYEDINLNFPARFACYNGKKLACTGDGVQAVYTDANGGKEIIPCSCGRQLPTYNGKDKCKLTGTLSVIITGADVIGGAWKFRTTSYNSVVGILSSLSMIKTMSGGVLAGIPLVMKLSPKSVTDPIGGNQQTIYVVSIEYRGSVQSLREIGYSILLKNQQFGIKIQDLENQAKLLIQHEADAYESDAEEIVGEFFPEQQPGYEPEPAQPTNRKTTSFSHLVTKAEAEPAQKPEPEKPSPAPVAQDLDFDLF